MNLINLFIFVREKGMLASYNNQYNYYELPFNNQYIHFILDNTHKPVEFEIFDKQALGTCFSGNVLQVSPNKILLTSCRYVSDSRKNIHIIFEEGYRIISIYNATNNNTRYIIDKELGKRYYRA